MSYEVEVVDVEAELEVVFEDQGASYRLTGRMGPHGPVLTGVEITGASVSVAHIRAPLISTFWTAFELSEGEIRRVTPRRGRSKHPEAAGNRLDEVARIARAAPFGHRGQAVADWFGISKGYARQLISRASQAGYPIWR